MKIANISFEIAPPKQGPWLAAVAEGLATKLAGDAYPLRLSVVRLEPGHAVVEATVVRGAGAVGANLTGVELMEPRRSPARSGPFAAVQVIPTGVRCAFGGYAGDATPVTNLLAASVDILLTHPNAVNASDLNEMAANVLYVEGKSLDDLLLGHVALERVSGNRIGTFIDPTGIGYMEIIANVLNAGRAAAGIDCGLHTILREEPGIRIEWSPAGCAVGTVDRVDAILEAVDLLVANGAQAIGGLSVIHGVTPDMFSRHLDGDLPNPSGGVEAIITHMISKARRLPTAHAPLPYYQASKERDTRNPRAAAEFISTPHYFSVLKGLARAPRPVPIESPAQVPAGAVGLGNVGAIVVPASCLGGIPALAAEFHNIPLVAVRENTTILDVTNAAMGMENVIEVASYLEAAGVLLALRHGIALESLRRPLAGARLVGESVREVLVRQAARDPRVA